MLKYSNYAIVASFLGLWIDSYLSDQIQIYTGFILIFTFGILHGANDLKLIETINKESKAIKYYKVLLCYIVIVALGAILFYAVPWLALILFILFSGYHFGEQQWNQQIIIEIKWIKFLFEIHYGLVILFLIFTFHVIEVQKIIAAITTIVIPLFVFQYVLKVLVVALFVLGSLVYFRVKEFKYIVVKEFFYLIVFAIIFKVSSLIWGFALYFIFWHSIPSMLDQMKFLFGEASFHHFKLYFRFGFLYWFVSLIGIALLYIIFKDQKIFNALFFSFLASITFPHVIIILKMFGKR